MLLLWAEQELLKQKLCCVGLLHAKLFDWLGQVRQLVENLALGRKLQALADPAMGSDGYFRLQYRWQRL